jgi:hypothetical protein
MASGLTPELTRRRESSRLKETKEDERDAIAARVE